MTYTIRIMLKNKNCCAENGSQQQGGFTIVELIIALLLVSLIIGVMSVIVLDGLSLNTRATRRTEASSLAFKKIQDYINLEYDNIPIGDDTLGYEVEDFTDEAEDILLSNPSAKVYITPASQLDTSTTSTTTNYSQTIQADSTFISGSEISAVDVDDATNIHWRE
jgi:type II secretory pathway pseudopilin PulG